MPRPTRVALALGSGGARGYAHIGVIEVLEEQGYEIVGVAGSSMGAVVGGLYAAGRLDDYVEWVRPLTQRDVLRLLDPSWREPGAIRGDKILGKVSELLGNALIEHLPIPFTAVATDLHAGRELWFQQGRLDAAIRASMALPTFFTPVVLEGRLLADGGLLDPVPVAATVGTPADLIVAVALSEEHAASTATVQEADDGDDASLFGTLPAGLRTLDVAQLALDAVQAAIARYRLAAHPPDVLVTIPKAACRTLDFHLAEELIALGRERAQWALEHQVSTR